MTDSPAFRLPLDPQEQPILDKILNIRDHLSILKQDRSSYVKSEDVVQYYTQLMAQVEALNRIRVSKRDEQNRVDTVLDDCFQLISLFFLTIGRNSEAPAVYSAISTVKRLLDHLKEAGFYSAKDLESIGSHIQDWHASVERGKESHSEHLLTLLNARIELCRATLKELQDRLSRLDPQMMGRYEKLVSILRSLSACNTRSRVGYPCPDIFPAKEVNEFEQQVWQIESEMQAERIQHDGISAEDAYADRLGILSLTEGEVQDGDKVVQALLVRCTLWIEIIREKQGKIDDRFQDTYDKLLKIRNNLEQMNLTQAWSLRETDLYSFQRQLDRVDESRVDGNFIDVEGRPADLHAQRTLLYLLRKSYAFIYQYIISSEPVSEALLPIYNQLLTLKRCLKEVKHSGGVDSPRELYPYSMKLNSIDNMKKDGKFMVGNDIPEGQASVTALLNECFELAYELRSEADEKNEENGEPDAEEVNGVGTKD
ncbi:hypothetical protein LTR37_010474 [Vermiconidia calcicola]|uniref:Uncharacterized protein n=1 Tax=Vermiconidia calcicola TaxID=1690605 RepID=A0ACC3N4U3_9PEZI|nr:hypothetical protein LTR37_010474 [Vermiconidia calcicola]